MRNILALLIILAAPFALAEERPSAASCLPGIGGEPGNLDECHSVLGSRSYLDDIHVDRCYFYAGNLLLQTLYNLQLIEFPESQYWFLRCEVNNGSTETLISFRYGIKYFEPGREAPFFQTGFGSDFVHSSGLIPGGLQPSEIRRILLVSPAIPKGVDPSSVKIVVEVTAGDVE